MHWYAALVRRSRERQFAEYLEAAGFEGYIPRETRRFNVRRRPREWKFLDVPIIGGLVFIGAAANLAQDAYAWHAVSRLPWYKALVGMNGEPRTISQTEIDLMMDARKGKDADLHVGYRSKVRVGQYARLPGAFGGLPVLKTRELTGRRALVLTELLGGREVEVDDAELEPWAAE